MEKSRSRSLGADKSWAKRRLTQLGPQIVASVAFQIERGDPESKTVFVDLTKNEIKSAPEYHEDGGHEDKDFRRRLGDYYRDRR